MSEGWGQWLVLTLKGKPEGCAITLQAEALHKQSHQHHKAKGQAKPLVVPHFNEDGQQIGLRYFIPPWRGWTDPPLGGKNLNVGTETIQWVVRARVQLANGSSLPLEKDSPNGWYEAIRVANFLDGREV